MEKGTSGQARVDVGVAPELLYDMISDVTRMGEWSPETIRCEWIDGATGPASGVAGMQRTLERINAIAETPP